jgi:uncharacterized protein with FMN-binding domain
MRKQTIKTGVKIIFMILTFVMTQSCGQKFWLHALKTDIESVDLKNVQDGIYSGEYESGVKARVQVSVSNNKIKEVKILEHKTQLGKRAEKIVDDVVEKQSLNVDAITGATMSSVVILKALEVALKKEYPNIENE